MDPYETFFVERNEKKKLVWRRCPICGDEIRDILGTAGAFETHYNIHKQKGQP